MVTEKYFKMKIKYHSNSMDGNMNKSGSILYFGGNKIFQNTAIYEFYQVFKL